MNVIREIQRINEKELDIAINNPSASWHEQYKDSAYIFIGGLPYDLTEGDVITIFSQYGEVVDVNLPRGAPQPGQNAEQQRKGKHRGFGFLMYEDQRSTVLAVDNLNGATVLGRTIRVDHVSKYKQKGTTGKDGKWIEPEAQSMNAAPEMIDQGVSESEKEDQSESHLDLEDPMAAYFRQQKRATKSTDRDKAREKEEKRLRKEERARIRAQRAARSGASSSRRRSRSGSQEEDERRNRYQEAKAASRSRSASPHRETAPRWIPSRRQAQT